MDNFSFKKLKLFHRKAKSEGNTPGQSTATSPAESRSVSPAPESGASRLKPDRPLQSAGNEEEDRARENAAIGIGSVAEARTGMGDNQPAIGAEAPAMSTKGYVTGSPSALLRGPLIMVEAPQEESARGTAAPTDGNQGPTARIETNINNTLAPRAFTLATEGAKFLEEPVLEGRGPSGTKCTCQPFGGENSEMLTTFKGSLLGGPSPSASTILVATASAASNGGEVKTSGWNATYEGVKETLRVIERVSDVFTPLKSTAAALLVIFEKIDAVMDIQEQFKVLLGKLQGLETMLKSHSMGLPQKIRDKLSGLSIALDTKCQELESELNHSLWKQVALSTAQQKKIASLIQEIGFALDITQLDFSIEVAGKIFEISDDMFLGKLGTVRGAEFNHEDRMGCMPGTRVGILAKLLAWAEDPSSDSIFWLNGMAGTGKTALSETLCSYLSQKGLLGASFFCSIKHSDRRNVRLIIPSLAQGLAKTHSGFSSSLVDAVAQCLDPLTLNLSVQYQTLILHPAEKTLHTRNLPMVLVVDALDECDQDDVELLLKAILNHKIKVPLKLFLTSRPETVIRESLGSHPASFQFHTIKDQLVRADIRMFIIAKFGAIPQLKNHYKKWPPQELNAIVDRSGRLFIIAFTLAEYVRKYKGNQLEAFQKLCSESNSAHVGTDDVDAVYKNILSEAGVGLVKKDLTKIQACLSFLVSSRQPLPVIFYAKLLNKNTAAIREYFKWLHSVVQMPEDGSDDSPISIYHASFSDYLTLRSQNCWWNCFLPLANTVAAGCCFDFLNAELHFGISGVTTSYHTHQYQPVGLFVKHVLKYACASWGNHVLSSAGPSGLSETILAMTRSFLEDKFLFWLEVLSITLDVATGISVLHQICQKLNPGDEMEIFFKDLLLFINEFLSPITNSAPHIYISALSFSTNPTMKRLYQPRYPGLPIIHFPASQVRSANQLMLYPKHRAHVRSIAFSPDGEYIVSGSNDGYFFLYNAHSGESVRDHYHTSLRCVAFSPDGKYIASGGQNFLIQLWDAQIGNHVLDFYSDCGSGVKSLAFSPDGKSIICGTEGNSVLLCNAHTGKFVLGFIHSPSDTTTNVTSVAFSPDGKYIVSGSEDKIVCLWDAQTGDLVLDPMLGHTEHVSSVVFSPDGKYIVSGSWDMTVCLWDAQTGTLVLRPMQHTGGIQCIAISPNGKYILSGTHDNTMHLWDAQTGAVVSAPIRGHGKWIMAVAFSPDGKYILSGSADCSVRLWDYQIGAPVPDSIQGHTDLNEIKSIAISPDGKHIVSGSADKTVCVWDTQTGDAVFKPVQGHTDCVASVAFSPDGKYIVSGSWDGTVCLWNAQTGGPVLNSLKGHTHFVTSVKFSPNGKTIASGSWDKTVRFWDAQTGEPVLPHILVPEGRIKSVAFSPDGKCIVSGSSSKFDTVHLWNAQTGDLIFQASSSHILQDHVKTVSSVAFSPDGNYIASGSLDCSVQLWDSQTGNLVSYFTEPNNGQITSIAFSPDGKYIVYGSNDNSMWLLDAHTLTPVMGPIEGHEKQVTSVVFSPNGKFFVSSSTDNTVCFWHVETSSPDIGSIGGHKQAVSYTSLSLQSGQDIGTNGANQGSKKLFFYQLPPGIVEIDKKYAMVHLSGSNKILLMCPSRFINLPPCIYKFGSSAANIEITHFVHGTQWKQICERRPPVSLETHICQIKNGM